MKIRLNGWHRVGVIISVYWVFFVIGNFVIAYSEIESFEEATSRNCPLLSKPFLSWYDSKAKKEISVYDKENWFTKSVGCGVAEDRAKVFSEQYQRGEIEPEVKIQYMGLIGAIVVPVLILWLGVYALVRLIKWVAAGFY